MKKLLCLALLGFVIALVPFLNSAGNAVDDKLPRFQLPVRALAGNSDSANLRVPPAPEPSAKPSIVRTPTAVPIPKPAGLANDALYILVRIGEQKLYLYKGSSLLASFTVSTGLPETPTPLTQWRISQKVPFDKPIPQYGTRWMRINRLNAQTGKYEETDYGIHGTDEPEKLGKAASAGCIRMLNKDVERLYQTVPLGTLILTVQ